MITKARNFFLHTKKGRILVLAMLAALIPLAWLAWWLGSPLFISQTVDEEFPLTVNAFIPEGMTRAEAEQIMGEAAEATVVVNESMPQLVGQKLQPAPIIATPTPTSTPEPTSTTTEEPDPLPMNTDPEQTLEPEATATPTPSPAPLPQPTATPTPEPAPAGPVALAQGEFRDADRFHRGRGTATIYQLPDGQRLLRFEDFEVRNGPRLHVYLSAHPDPESSSQVSSGGYVDLGRIKGNKGNQNYEIPESADQSELNSVVIYCVPFRVVFSVAPLTPAS